MKRRLSLSSKPTVFPYDLYLIIPTPSQLIVPTLRVGMPPRTLRVRCDAERHGMRYHAERGNDQLRGREKKVIRKYRGF